MKKKDWKFVTHETKRANKDKRDDLVDITASIIARELLKRREEFLENEPHI